MSAIIRQMPLVVYLFFTALPVAAAAIFALAGLRARRYAAVVKATPTSNIGMAADGYCEFEGRAEAIGGQMIKAPLTSVNSRKDASTTTPSMTTSPMRIHLTRPMTAMRQTGSRRWRWRRRAPAFQTNGRKPFIMTTKLQAVHVATSEMGCQAALSMALAFLGRGGLDDLGAIWLVT